LPSSQPDTHFGLVFMHADGYLTACIHGTIGAVVAAVESGFISEDQANDSLRIETPSGIVLARLQRRAGQGPEVTVRNVPSFVAESDVEVVYDGKCVRADVVYGGSFFAIVNARDLDLRVEPRCIAGLQQAGTAIRNAINESKTYRHPDRPDISGIDLVQITDE